ncbi:MAG: type II secretion system protein [Fimbriimonadaceae bacterium]|nr:type II secretion system protein [Fimbriimonadaceae bacterium]
MTRRRGFTLIELLTVIAIIALLSAIIFPVFARAKDSAAKASDISDMNSLRSALQLYRVDQGAYPPALLGYVTLYSSGPQMGNVIPANELKTGFLMPRRVNSIETFRPNNLRVGSAQVTNAVYPGQDPRAVGTAAILDLNGDGSITGADDTPGARQAYGPTDGNVCYGGGVPPCGAGAAQFYVISGYDTQSVNSPSGIRTELRYTLFWSQLGLTTGGADDDPRQLGYSEPPETTVVTWNSQFREFDGNGAAARARTDQVLFLGGGARPYDSRLLAERSWRVMP